VLSGFGSDEGERRGVVVLILLAAVSVWLLAGVFVFMTVLLLAWHRGRQSEAVLRTDLRTGSPLPVATERYR
jgi:hypothetical protein